MSDIADPLQTIAQAFLKAAGGLPESKNTLAPHGVPGQLPPLEVSPRVTTSAYAPNPAPDPSLKAFVEAVRTCGQPSSGPIPADPFAVQLGRSLPARPRFDTAPFSLEGIRKEFPILRQRINGQPLAWFDNAATTQKPQSVIDAVSKFYEDDNSNIHRGAHTLAARATNAYEGARDKIRDYIGASSSEEVIFVRGTTEGINLVAQTWGRTNLKRGDEIVLTVLEHHANIVPWQMVARETGAIIRVAPVNDRGEILLDEYERLLSVRTKLVALTHANNSLGTILPVAEMAWAAKKVGAVVLVDGAQSVAHLPVNVQQWGIDFFVFSGHKVFAPTGVGAVWGRKEVLADLPPWQGGGNMIRTVTFDETTYNDAPARFEAGTPTIGDAVGLGAALDWVNKVGLHNIQNHEHEILEYATDQVSRLDRIRLIGSAREKVGVLSFVHERKSVQEVAKHLDQHGIAVRAGHHCAQPSLRRFGLEATVRPSFSVYNTREEVDRLVSALRGF